MNSRANTSRRRIGLVAAGAIATLGLSGPPAQAQDKVFVMKMSTATINDTQHEWLKRFAAAVEKDSGGRIKGEIYPASQLGPIPRQIEGVQFGSIQVYIGPPEFLSGIDVRYEALSAPGLFASTDQAVRVINDPAVQKLMFGLGVNKGIEGIGLAPIGPSSTITKFDVHHLSDFKGKKIRVLASAFQTKPIEQLGATPVAMTLGDVVPALQQGAVDGAVGGIVVWTPMHFQDAAKFVTETGQPAVYAIAEVNKNWYDSLPPDLQKIVDSDAAKEQAALTPIAIDIVDKARKGWVASGGELISLPADEQAQMMKIFLAASAEVSKSKPAVNEAYTIVNSAAQKLR